MTLTEAANHASRPAVAHAIAAMLLRQYGHDADALAAAIRAEVARQSRDLSAIADAARCVA